MSEGTGFTSVKDSTGNYTVTFTAAFSDGPTVCVTPITGVIGSVTDAPGTGSVVVHMRSDSGAAADSAFSFIAIGPA